MSPNAPPTPASRARRLLESLVRVLRGSARLLAVLALATLALAAGVLRSEWFELLALDTLEDLLGSRLGETVLVKEIDVRLWPPAVDVVGLNVYERSTGDSILAAERIHLPVSLGGRGVGIGQVILTRPAVHLHLDEQGRLLEFRDRRRSGTPKPLRRLPWSSLRIEGGSFLLQFPDGEVELANLELRPTLGPVGDLGGRLRYRFRGLEDEATLDLRGLVLGPEVVHVPALDLDTGLVDLAARATVQLGDTIDASATLRVDLDQLEPALTPPRAAHGFLDADLAFRGTSQEPEAWISISGSHLGLDVPGILTPLLTYELGELRATAVARRDGLHVEHLVLPWGDGQATAWGTITPDRRLVDGHLTLDDVRLLPLLQAFDAAPTPWVDFRSDAEIAVEGKLSPLLLEGTFDFGVADLHVGDRPLEARGVSLLLDLPHADARGTLVLERDHITLRANRVRGPRSAGSMVADIGFGPKGPLDLQFDLDRADLSDFQPLADVGLEGRGRVTGRISGPFNRLQFVGAGDVRDFEVLGIRYADHLVADLFSPDLKSIQLTGARAELGQSTYGGRYAISFRSPISMDTAIEVDRGRVEDMVNMFVDLQGLRGDLTGTLWLEGPLYDMDGQADLALSEVEVYGERFPLGEAHGYMDQGLFTLDDLRLRRDEGKAGLTLRGSVERSWALDMELVADGFALEKLDRLADDALPLRGDLAAHLHLGNTLFDPSPSGRLTLTGLSYAGNAAADSVVRLDTVDGVTRYVGALLGGTARVEGTLGLWEEQPYALTATLTDLPAHVFYPTAADGSPVRATVSGAVEVSGDFGEVWSPVTLRGRLDDVDVAWASHRLRNQRPWVYEQEGPRFLAQDIGLVGGDTDLRLTAAMQDVVEVSGEGRVDLDLLRAVVPGLSRADGTARVALHTEGSAPVRAVLEVDMSADLLRHDSAPLTFEDTRAHLEIRSDRILVSEVEGGLGGGTFSGGGAIEAEGWVPTRYDLDMEVRDAEVQWVDSLPPAIGEGRFTFDGPVGALLMAGEVTVQDMTFADRIDWEDWVVEYRDEMLVDPATTYDEEPLFSLNVHIGADRTLFLRNNVAEGVASADLRLIGDTVRPGLVGAVTVNEGTAFLQDREFRIDRGVLLWSDPWTWDPYLDLSLLTDIQNQDQRYRVDYLVSGPFSDWHSSSRSDPPLPQADVNALLWFGMTTDQLEQLGELPSAVAQSIGDLLVTDFFVSGQAGELGQQIPELLFDRIDLATGVNARGVYSPDPRLLVEKRLDELEADLKWELNLVRPEDSYLAASRNIGGIWSLSLWYATLQRDRVLPIGGAYGIDVLARTELE